jgi:type I restriction enzyme, R subunit
MESERETRKRRIDPLLKAAGWTIVPFSPTLRLQANENLAIEEYPTANQKAATLVPPPCRDRTVFGEMNR